MITNNLRIQRQPHIETKSPHSLPHCLEIDVTATAQITDPNPPPATIHPATPAKPGLSLTRGIVIVITLAVVSLVGYWFWQKQFVSGKTTTPGDSQASLATQEPSHSEGEGNHALAASSESKSQDSPDLAAKAKPAVIVTTSPAEVANVQRMLKAVGTLEGFEEISLSPQVGGRILAIHKEVGDLVAPGDLLMEIDPQDALLTVKECQSALDLELSKLGLKEPPEQNFNVEAVPAVQKAMLLELNSLRTLERVRQLASQKVTTQDDLERAETNYEVAKVEARQQRLLAGETIAAIRQKIALLKTAEKRLQDTRVVVPTLTCLEGDLKVPCSPQLTVAERHASEGENVVVTQISPVFLLVIEHPLKLKVSLPERVMGQVKTGQKVRVTIEAYPGEVFTGEVKRVNPTIQRSSRTFEIEVAIPNEDRRLKSGSFAVAQILTDHRPTAVVVPESAIVRFAGVVKLFKVTPQNTVREVLVTLGERIEQPVNGKSVPYVEVTGELQPGETVVTSGQSQLVDGIAIRLREPAPNANSEATAAPAKGAHQ